MIDSKDAYEEKYAKGYGLMHPDGHVIRVYERMLKNKFDLSGAGKEKIFDFGCGTGAHLRFFREKGFVPYGLDIIASAIEACRKQLPEYERHFQCIVPGSSFKDRFPGPFDVILANQSLYYLNDNDLNATLIELEEMLGQNGVVVFSMMGMRCYYYNHVTRDMGNGLQEVTLKGRLNETTYINFVSDEEDLVSRFEMFDRVSVGWYGAQIDDTEGEGFHYLYIGKKKQ